MVSSLIVCLIVSVALIQTAVFSTTIFLHRTATHRALVLHPAVAWLFRFALWITTGISTKEWVAVHRKHHAFTDRDGDPHSPRLLGFWRVQLLNVYYYAREARNPDTLRTFAPDIRADRLDTLFARGWLGPLLGTVLLCMLLGLWIGLLAASLHAVLYVFVLAPLINGLGHWRGSQNFANTAYNSLLMAWVTGGESLHNNHHAHARSPKFSMRRGEFDPSWPVIRLLVVARLVAVMQPSVGLRQAD